MKGVILAAGFGSRLRPLTDGTPKPLLEIGGRPLIHYPLYAMGSVGISDIAVVVGYQSQMIQDFLKESHPDLTVIENVDYDGGNALSVYAARDFASDGPFVVCMGDHTISPGITETLLSEDPGVCVLCVDWEAILGPQISDATKVEIDDDGYISAIGKHLRSWDAIDTGVFMMTPEVFEAVDHLVELKGVGVSISDVVTYLGRSGAPFATCNVSGMFWADVDTLEDYWVVNSLLSNTKSG